jgi:predicted lipid-binding transport protein (Tim44 family)
MFGSRFRLSLVFGACAVVLTMIAADVADARGRISIGSRGSRTHSAPPATTTAPTARPVERSVTQPTNPTVNAAPRPAPRIVPVVTAPLTPGAASSSPGFMGGLFGAGLFGLVLGAGLTGGLGSPASFVGFAVQMAIVAAIGWALFGLMPDRNQSASHQLQPQRPPRNRSEFGLRNATPR